MPTTDTSTTITTRGDLEIVQERVFDAPRELVYNALNDPELIPRWWGPSYLTTTVEKMDVQPGGGWRFVQRAPDGGEHAFNGRYLEVVAPERVSMTFNYEGLPGDHEAVSTLVLTDEGGKTRMTSTMVFKTKEDRDGMVQSGMESGARETDERLAVVLEELKKAKQ
jgi:uncharacterized protein YndB with AHSA1/START domain